MVAEVRQTGSIIEIKAVKCFAGANNPFLSRRELPKAIEAVINV